ncbi:unnamed protein product [Gordionus sp. m RMFG-2023]|uniref:transmembrane protein 256 homolog n=1 Tax=Gordionus sp. m RMFG-2023 TaxID=3053472 RepID=UPI0030E0BB8D
MNFQNYIKSLYNNPFHYLSLGYFAKSPSKIVISPAQTHYFGSPSHTFLVIGAVSGALAHVLAAYGAHKIHNEAISDDLKQIYDTANKFHFYSSLSLMIVPLSRKPLITGTLLVLGMIGFSGSCYYYTLTKSQTRSMITPIGAMLTTLGWLSFALC